MKGLTRFLLIVVAVGVLGGAAFLATWDIPAPTTPVEEVIADDRFPR